MKILLVIDQYQNGNNGTTISARRFAEGLQKRGHTVTILTTGEEGENKFILNSLKLPIGISGIVKSQGMSFAVPDKEIIRKAMEDIDIVHFYMPFWLSRTAKKIADELKIPNTAAFHVQPENITYTIKMGKVKLINDKIYEEFRDDFFNKFNRIHCPSQFIANQLKEHEYTSKLYVISNGIQDKFKPMPKEKNEKIVITMVGRLSGEKRQDLLFDAIKKSKYEKDIQLVLAGKGPKYKQYIKIGESLTNKPIIEFCDETKLMDLLHKTDLYVHTSDAEIEAISCIEAIACGNVPIISNSNKSATPQFALDERSLFEAGNSDDLARKIDNWLDNKQELDKMRKTYAESADKYRIENSMKKIEEMFEDEIAERSN